MEKIVFEDYFNKSEGKPFIYNGREIKMSDKIVLPSNKVGFKVTFLSKNSDWNQGIVLQTKGELEINGLKLLNKAILWEHTAPKEVHAIIKSKDKILFVYNVWDTGDGTMHYGHNGGALYIEQTSRYTLYNCNDGHPDDDFNDLLFKIEYSENL
jgi:hypothetical protein